MKKFLGLLMVMVLCAGVISGCGSSEEDGSGGLGKLEIEDGTAPSIGGGDNKIPANTETPSSEVPTEPKTEPPTEPQKVATRFYSDDNFSATIPADWEVYSHKFDDGSGKGNDRLVVLIYDPTDINNCIFYFSALEPWFTSESDRRLLSTYDRTLSDAPVIDNLDATSLLKNWGSLISVGSAQGFMYPNYMGNYSVQQVVDSKIIEQTNNKITSIAMADAFASGSDNVYRIVATNTFRPFYFAHLNMTWYISYSNLGYALDVNKYDEYMPMLQECLGTFDFSKFNNSNKIEAGDGNQGVMSSSDIKEFLDGIKK